ncbi:hypothetical protein M413DRAFT_375971 [Hebeloma cylindrosporum]|uniref:Uncharacterized protein n=1 Tax=Hebeloma cylindrosporum TaxID=76867 RepID=A0A0C3CK83_HEBCY|nr:hypothetical protein M413DRAFT_375971 [Hebeloma cylindrosporum h7]
MGKNVGIEEVQGRVTNMAGTLPSRLAHFVSKSESSHNTDFVIPPGPTFPNNHRWIMMRANRRQHTISILRTTSVEFERQMGRAFVLSLNKVGQKQFAIRNPSFTFYFSLLLSDI